MKEKKEKKETNEYNATHRFARISVRKVRPLLDLIRGHYADDALDVLKYMPHRGARMVEQVLKSAMANAEDKGIRNVGELIVRNARGDGGPMVKRLMPRARGMAYLIRRRTAHIAIGLIDLATWKPDQEEPADDNGKPAK
jgi:large subunit ribosomal protein L22